MVDGTSNSGCAGGGLVVVVMVVAVLVVVVLGVMVGQLLEGLSHQINNHS